MRGKAKCSSTNAKSKWITPAHAGKRIFVDFYNCVFQDHPRACGEKSASNHTAAQQSGSPPRMRGKAVSAVVQLFGDRITPAHAGKSPLSCRRNGSAKDHPRACGEKDRKKTK